MAASESQGKTIFLVIFVVLTVVGFSAFYYQYDQNDRLKQTAKEAQNNESTAKKATQEKNQEYVQLKDRILGTTADTDHSGVISVLEKSMQAPKLNETRLAQMSTYPTLVGAIDYLQDQLAESDKQVAALQEQKGSLEKDLKGVKAQYELEVAEARNAQKAAEKEKADEISRVNTLLAQRDADLLALQKSASELRDKNLQLTRTMEQSEKKFAQTTSDLQRIIDQKEAEVVRSKLTEFEHEDGAIQFVDGPRVYVNRGVRDGLRKGLTFGVYGKDVGGNPYQLPKANLEIIRLLDAHQALGKVTNSIITEPVLPGDLLFNPVWSPGHKESIAISGLIYLDSDDKPDNEEFKELVIQNGGKIDAEVNIKTGQVKGEITVNTGWLVMGEIPEFKEANEINPNINQLAQLLTQAQTKLPSPGQGQRCPADPAAALPQLHGLPASASDSARRRRRGVPARGGPGGGP